MHAISLIVTHSGSTPLELTPDEARRCLATPAYVVVENAESDGAFLEAMMIAWKRRPLIDAQTEYWWEIRQAGGMGEIPKIVEQIRARTIGPMRVFVLSDSDRLYAGHITNTVRQIETYCTQHQVPYAILAKRESENYLPVNVLQNVPRRRHSTYQAFLHLTPLQRDYYDMKDGFRHARDHVNVPPEQHDLFAHVPPSVLTDLCGGFGRDVWQYYKTARAVMTKDAIRLACPVDPEEIERILDAIEALL